MPSFIDLHTHILPSLDEGAKNIEEAVAMAKVFSAAGYSHVVGTPHILTGLYANTPEAIQKKTEEVCSALEEARVPLKVLPGAEYYWDFEFYTLMEKDRIQTINSTGQYVLVEFPAFGIPRQIEEVAFRMGIKGIKPLLAHPERNGDVILDFHKATLLGKWGFLLQVDLLSLIGAHGPDVKKTAELLLKSGAVFTVAVDAHTIDNVQDCIGIGIPHLRRIVGEEGVEQLLHTNPRLIIEGQARDLRQEASTE